MPSFRSRNTVRTVVFTNENVVRITTLVLPPLVRVVVQDTTPWHDIQGAEGVWRRPRVMVRGLQDTEIRVRYALTFWIGWACAGLMPPGMLGVLALLDHGHAGYALAVLVVLACVLLTLVVFYSNRADVLSLHVKTAQDSRPLGDFVCAHDASELCGGEPMAEQVWNGLLQGLAQYDGVSDPKPATWEWRRGRRTWACAPPGWDTAHVDGLGATAEDRVTLFRRTTT